MSVITSAEERRSPPGEARSHAASGSIGRVELREGWLRVRFGEDRGHADFHFRWLRHNCDVDRHPKTGERTVDSSELPEELRAASAAVEGDALLVTWAHDGRVSRYPLSWLWEHAYARGREEPPAMLSDVSVITIDGRALDMDARVAEAIARARAHGAAVVRRSPTDVAPPELETERIIHAFSANGLRVIGTHFGRIEDLRTDNTTNQNTDQLGYTDAPVDLHTDQPFLQSPPRWQLLQGIRTADEGGESYLADAVAAGRLIAAHDRRAYELLSSVLVRFHRKQKAFESIVDAPILGRGPDGPIVRHSYFTMAPHRLPFSEMEEWYRAYDGFSRMVRDRRNQLRFLLGPGDFLLYDNHRMLHARTAFRGARWVRGVYFDR
jgi:gamma-butyrobetaine dioxygenase/trimethyllysine dioxygenase